MERNSSVHQPKEPKPTTSAHRERNRSNKFIARAILSTALFTVGTGMFVEACTPMISSIELKTDIVRPGEGANATIPGDENDWWQGLLGTGLMISSVFLIGRNGADRRYRRR
jgi:hypothetical protein